MALDGITAMNSRNGNQPSHFTSVTFCQEYENNWFPF
jgi:hypothetical protein